MNQVVAGQVFMFVRDTVIETISPFEQYSSGKHYKGIDSPMIRLFRKVRQELLSKDKYSLYILYASGEILLVIIGIIIALQIDNWNETRKEENNELQLYSDLLEDLNSEYENIEFHIDDVNSYDELHVHVYNEISGKAPYDPDQFYNFLLWFHRYNMFIKDKYHESLSRMSNDIIHDGLKLYIRQETNTKEAVNEWNEHQLQQVRPYLSRYGINDTEVMFDEQSDEFAPIINNMDLIDHSKLQAQYGTEEFDQLLFTIRFKTLWMAQNLTWLQQRNHEFQLILSNELASTKLQGTYDLVEPEAFDEFVLVGTSTGDLIKMLREEVENNGSYDFANGEVNAYGYDLLRDGKLEDALTVFELNTRLYPDAWNTYDSYGEGLLVAGDTIKGIEAYEKSLELNPQNNTAIVVINEFKD